MRAHVGLLAVLAATSLHARSVADRAVFGVLVAEDGELSSMDVLHRAPVTPELDLVIARGGHGGWHVGMPVPRGPELLGLFLQDRARPELVYTLFAEPGACPCGGRIERATVTDAVISCTLEKSERLPHEKFIYDVRAKELVGHVLYRPFTTVRMFAQGDGAVLVSTDTKRLVAVEFQPDREPPFRVLRGADALPWTSRVEAHAGWVGMNRESFLYVVPAAFEPLRFGPEGRFTLTRFPRESPDDSDLTIEEVRDGRVVRHALPRSTAAEFARKRPGAVEDYGGGSELGFLEFLDGIGPHQLEGDTLWFGKSFYDSEGISGIGGFGTFDPIAGEYRLLAPAEILDWSVGALQVDPDAAWMALVYYGEWGNSSGGVIRFDRSSAAVRRFEVPDVGHQFLRVGERLLLATDFGVTVIQGEVVRRYFLDVMNDGRLRVAESLFE